MNPILLAQGNGGNENRDLIENLFYKHLGNETLLKSEDAAVIEAGRLAFTTDSFTVSPLIFAGGDIGKLSICGTCNDLAMMGAQPKYLSLAMMIEEGLEHELLESITRSMAKELEKNGAQVVTGDTKVVPKGSVDKLFITTTGIGEIVQNGISSQGLTPGDAIIVSGSIGRHGAAIFAAREGIELQSRLTSDAASLWPLVDALLQGGIKPVAMRDATRGGLAAVLNEWAQQSQVGIAVEESEVPVSKEVQGICELLGFEAYNLANEGTFVLALKKDQVPDALDILQRFECAADAAYIGEVTREHRGRVILESAWKTQRFLEMPSGELLPRIC